MNNKAAIDSCFTTSTFEERFSGFTEYNYATGKIHKNLIDRIEYICKTSKIANSDDGKLYTQIIRKNIYDTLYGGTGLIQVNQIPDECNLYLAKEYFKGIPEGANVIDNDYIKMLVIEIQESKMQKVNNDGWRMQIAQGERYFRNFNKNVS